MNAPSAAESSDIDKVPLAESLHQLHAFIEAKETEQALVLEQQLLKDYPQLAVEAADKAQLSKQQLEFKKLQQQLHQLAK